MYTLRTEQPPYSTYRHWQGHTVQAHDPDILQSTGQGFPAQGTLECPEAAHAFLLQGMRQHVSEAQGVK
jgi:hypothetical protein